MIAAYPPVWRVSNEDLSLCISHVCWRHLLGVICPCFRFGHGSHTGSSVSRTMLKMDGHKKLYHSHAGCDQGDTVDLHLDARMGVPGVSF